MRTTIKVLSLLLALASSFNPTSQAASANAVVLSPSYTTNQAQSVWQHLSYYLVTAAPVGSTWWPIDGDTLATICGPFTIPALAKDVPRARIQALARPLNELQVWFAHQAPALALTNAGLIRFPEALDFIAQHKADGPLTVYVVANPLYLPTNDDRAVSFAGRKYPPFGQLYAARQQTPLSLEGRRNQLQNVVVHFNYLTNSVFDGDRHHLAILTWWQAFLEGEGASLGLFESGSLKDFFGTKAEVKRDKVVTDSQDLNVAMLEVPAAVETDPADAPTNSLPSEVAATLKRWAGALDRLEREKDFCQLANQLERARAEVPGRYQPTNWCARLVAAMVACADAMDDPAAQRTQLRAALALAGSCPCDTNVPALKLSLLDAQEVAEQEKAAKLLAAKKAAENEKATREKAAKDRALTEYSSLLQAGDAIPGGTDVSSLSNKLTLYENAGAVAKTHGLSSAEVEPRVLGVQQQLDRLLVPADLPVGCKAEITRISLEQQPYVFLDVSVTLGSGEPVRGLLRKDFRIVCDGRQPKEVQVASVRSQPPWFHLVLCVDESQSMSGKPLNATKAAAKAMLAELLGNDRLAVKVIAFSDRAPRLLCDWTTDMAVAVSAIDQLKAKGQTALYDAVAAATESLKEREGERRLLVFSDGGDNASRYGFKPADLAGQLRAAGIVTYAIGLHLPQADQRALRRFADDYLDAGSPDQLQSAFADARARLVREVYRFVLTTDAMPRSFQVKVGGTNAVMARQAAQIP